MLKFSAHEYPYPSQRQSVFARRGMVAASQPLAAQAGIEIMQKGGNAIDAAIATAAALTVVEPTGCGLGGDAFALVWCKGQLHGLNGNGHAPAALSIEAVKAAGHQQMPLYGWTSVTVPGCPSAWAELSKRFGKLPFADLLQPAISLARDGFPLSPVVAHQWQISLNEFSPHRDEVLQAWFDTFLIDGRAPRAGEIFRNPAQARTLEELAATSEELSGQAEQLQQSIAFFNTGDDAPQVRSRQPALGHPERRGANAKASSRLNAPLQVASVRSGPASNANFRPY